MSTGDQQVERDEAGVCISCGRVTDTALGLRGDAEWVTTGLVALGVADAAAPLMVSRRFGCEDGTVPTGILEMAVTVCTECAALAAFPPPIPAAPGSPIPTIMWEV